MSVMGPALYFFCQGREKMQCSNCGAELSVRHKGRKGWTKFVCGVCRSYYWVPPEDQRRRNLARANADQISSAETSGPGDDIDELGIWWEAKSPED